jgi:hypothetical protein
MTWQYDDGGREAAGYKGTTGDCVTRAIAIACELPYQEVYDALNIARQNPEKASPGTRRKLMNSSARTGIFRRTSQQFLEDIGWKWVPTMAVGSGCQVHLKADELPDGRIICKVSKHMVAVIDGVIHDTHDCSRGETRCVYGVYMAPGAELWHP